MRRTMSRLISRMMAREQLAPAMLACGLVATLVFAGCGVSTSTGGNGPGTTTTGQSGAGIVVTASASVGGQSTTILANSGGMTLYYFADDSATVSACTASCASTWPPLIVSSGSPSSTASLPGTLSARDVGNGQQVLYNGHPLYRYSADSAPGDTHGEGIEGKWHVATPGVAVNTGPVGQPTQPSGKPTPTECTGYYCY